MPMSPSAMACAALLLGYSGPLPDYAWIDARPGHRECQSALNTDRAYFEAEFGPNVTCFAVTYTWRSRSGKSYVPPYALIVADRKQPFRVFVIESIRVVLAHTGQRMTSREIYELARRAEEKCNGTR